MSPLFNTLDHSIWGMIWSVSLISITLDFVVVLRRCTETSDIFAFLNNFTIILCSVFHNERIFSFFVDKGRLREYAGVMVIIGGG